MAPTVKPLVVVSKCLEFAPCRYNGALIADRFVKQLEPHVIFLPICPEIEIGLGVPRDAIRIVSEEDGTLRLIQPATGRDLSEKMRHFSDRFLSGLDPVDGFILKSRSPSCGIKDAKRFPSQTADAPVGKGAGFFAAAAGMRFPAAAIEDEKRLSRPRIREQFLTKLFTLRRFREARRAGTAAALARFHSTHRLLLTAHRRKGAALLGRIVDPQAGTAAERFSRYEPLLLEILSRSPRPSGNVDALTQAFGECSDRLSKKEKAFFFQTLERYRNERLSLRELSKMLKTWSARLEDDPLGGQTFFEPYPESLSEKME